MWRVARGGGVCTNLIRVYCKFLTPERVLKKLFHTITPMMVTLFNTKWLKWSRVDDGAVGENEEAAGRVEEGLVCPFLARRVITSDNISLIV